MTNDIYPQFIKGKFRTLKDYSGYVLLLLYFLSSWIRWDRGEELPSQAIMVDLPGRKAYLFGIEIWPEEVYYITGLLILGALGLFFITSLFGRIWCGYTCPHTVFVDLFIKVENYFQGDRNARIKLDSSDEDPQKFMKKLKTHICWLLLSFSFAFGWVCYFYDAPKLFIDVVTFNVSTGGLAWLIGLTLTTYLFAGFIKQRVCVYMCPYGRFQSAMLDNNSSVVTYHDWRGEPRGNLKDEKNSGDCIDCGKCVYVCPMGIDIRDGLQLSCIGCGLCIDACDSVMEKVGRPLGLISYDSFNSTQAKMNSLPVPRKILHLKTFLFLGVFTIVASVMLYKLITKPDFSFSVIRDRGPLVTILPDGLYRNTFKLKLYNKTSYQRPMNLQISGLEDFFVKESNNTNYESANLEFNLGPQENANITLYVKAPAGNSEYERIYFNLLDLKTKKVITKESKFIFDTK